MRIVIAAYYYLPHVGGGTWYFYHIARRLARHGNDVTLFAPRVQYHMARKDLVDPPEPRLKVERLNRIPLPTWFSAFAGLLLFRARFIRSARRSDIIVGQFHPHHSLGLGVVIMGKVLSKPVAIRVEDYRRWMFEAGRDRRSRLEFVLAGPLNLLNEWAAQHASMILVVDSFATTHFGAKRPVGPRLVASPNGVDFINGPRSEDCALLRAGFRIPEDAPLVAFVGRYSGPEYRVDVLLEAFERLHKVRPEAILLLVGDSLPPDLIARFGTLLAEGAVREIGPVPQSQALAITALANVAVGPLGPTRTTPVKVLEAIAQGTPIVIGRDSVGPEILAMGLGVRVVDPDPKILAESLLALFESPRPSVSDEERSRMRPYDWESIAATVESELARLVALSRIDAEGPHPG